MRLEQTFTVQAPIDEVWAALIDVERIAPCLPGADIAGREEDGSYKGSFKVKLGPTTASYSGVLRMEEVDEAARRAVMSAKGTDKRGQGGATATIVNRLREEGGATVVEVDTDYAITGKLARFGRSGMIEDISKRLLREFASCLEETLRSQPASGDDRAVAAPEAATVSGGGTAATTPGDGGDAAATVPGTAGVAPDAGAAAAAAAAAAPRPVAPRAAPRPAKPISGVRLVLGALLDRLRRLFAGRRHR